MAIQPLRSSPSGWTPTKAIHGLQDHTTSGIGAAKVTLSVAQELTSPQMNFRSEPYRFSLYIGICGASRRW